MLAAATAVVAVVVVVTVVAWSLWGCLTTGTQVNTCTSDTGSKGLITEHFERNVKREEDATSSRHGKIQTKNAKVLFLMSAKDITRKREDGRRTMGQPSRNWQHAGGALRHNKYGDPIAVGARFSAPVHTGPGAHHASYTMGTGSRFRGVKQQGHDVKHPPPPSAEVKERVEIYLYSPSGPSWPVPRRTSPFIIYFKIHILNDYCSALNVRPTNTHTLKRTNFNYDREATTTASDARGPRFKSRPRDLHQRPGQ